MIRRRTTTIDKHFSNLDVKPQCDLFIDIVSRIALEDLDAAKMMNLGMSLIDVISNEVGIG